jgi:hypothetical protein
MVHKSDVKAKFCSWLAALSLIAVTGASADQTVCPQAMSPAVEAKLFPVLRATADALKTGDWSSKAYESSLDTLLSAKDAASAEARVALMDYPIATAYAEQLTCTVSVGGQRALRLLELYSRCDIAPSHSPVPRDHSRALRAETIKAWKAGNGKGSCEGE